MSRTSKLHSSLLVDASNLAIGDTTYDIHCPSCGENKSFSVTRTNLGLLYICFRSKCGIRGFIASGAPLVFSQRLKTTKYFKYETESLSSDVAEYLENRYSITGKHISDNNIVWAPDMGRLILPCFTSLGYIWGYMARAYEDLTPNYEGRKSILYRENSNVPSVSWAKPQPTKSVVVLLEDQLSSIRVAPHFTSIALLGHQIPDNLWELIRNRTVVISLDEDVKTKVIKYLTKYALWAKRVVAVYPNPDPKDMTEEQFSMYINTMGEVIQEDGE